MTSEVELKEIRRLLQKLNRKVDGLNDLVEERLIGCEEPTKEDVAAIKEAAEKKTVEGKETAQKEATK